MYFHAGVRETILFQQLQTRNAAELSWACLLVFVTALLYELLKFGRGKLFRYHRAKAVHRVKADHQVKDEAPSERTPLLNAVSHMLQTILLVLQTVLTILLMLVFMIYNVYLCVCIIAGAALGYFLTGW